MTIKIGIINETDENERRVTETPISANTKSYCYLLLVRLLR